MLTTADSLTQCVAYWIEILDCCPEQTHRCTRVISTQTLVTQVQCPVLLLLPANESVKSRCSVLVPVRQDEDMTYIYCCFLWTSGSGCCQVHLRAVCLLPFGSNVISWVQSLQPPPAWTVDSCYVTAFSICHKGTCLPFVAILAMLCYLPTLCTYYCQRY